MDLNNNMNRLVYERRGAKPAVIFFDNRFDGGPRWLMAEKLPSEGGTCDFFTFSEDAAPSSPEMAKWSPERVERIEKAAAGSGST